MSEGSIGGQPALVRARKGMPSSADIQLFSHLIIVTWKFDGTTDRGFPPSDVIDEMTKFEDKILNACDEDKWWGTGVVVLTLPGIREWRFYTPNPQSFVTEFSEALSGLGPYPIEIQTFEDPDWAALIEFQSS